jgi:hypothetical protein
MLTGSVASAYHGASRATMDIDLVIDPLPVRLEAFVRGIASAFNRMLLYRDVVGRPVSEVLDAAGAIAVDYPWHPYGYEAQTWFLSGQGGDMRRAIALGEEAIRVARRSGYWTGAKAMVAGDRKSRPT